MSAKQTSGSSNILGSKKSVQYGIVVDCGSSGSRVFAYQWDRRHGVKDIKADHVYEAIDTKQPVIKKVEPGLSDQTPVEALDTVSELLTYVEPHIPEDAHADTIVYILATAGLRMIPFDQRQDILRTLRTKLPKMHKFDIQEVSVISGQEEALFAWLSINSIKGRLCSENTAAVLDMGGGSFQVAIPLNDEQLMAARENPEISSSDIQTVQLSCKKSHSVFIHTWLGYGANKARDRYETFLFPNATKTERVPDPCLNPGMQRGKFIGTGNFAKCRKRISGNDIFSRKLKLNSNKHNLLSCLDEEKDIACTYPLDHEKQLPRISKSTPLEIIGISEFYYTSQDIFNMAGKFNAKEFHERTAKWCRTGRDIAYANWEQGAYQADEYRLQIQCFKAAWVSVVLVEGLGFDIFNEKFDMTVLDTIDGRSLQWTLGALLYKTGLSGFDRAHPRAPKPEDLAADDFIGAKNSYPYAVQQFALYFLCFLMVSVVLVIAYQYHVTIRGENYVDRI